MSQDSDQSPRQRSPSRRRITLPAGVAPRRHTSSNRAPTRDALRNGHSSSSTNPPSTNGRGPTPRAPARGIAISSPRSEDPSVRRAVLHSDRGQLVVRVGGSNHRAAETAGSNNPPSDSRAEDPLSEFLFQSPPSSISRPTPESTVAESSSSGSQLDNSDINRQEGRSEPRQSSSSTVNCTITSSHNPRDNVAPAVSTPLVSPSPPGTSQTGQSGEGNDGQGEGAIAIPTVNHGRLGARMRPYDPDRRPRFLGYLRANHSIDPQRSLRGRNPEEEEEASFVPPAAPQAGTRASLRQAAATHRPALGL